jgi:RNA polymerase sigma-70 factor (ECF subfamily)
MRGGANLEHERAVVKQARDDPGAFQQLYRHYLPGVYAYVASRVDTADDAEDLTAEVFLKVVEGLDRFEYRATGSFAAWLFRIAHNLVCDFHRHHRVRGRPLPLHAVPEPPSRQAIPEEEMLREESVAEVRRLLDTLAPRRREVLTLRFFGGLRNREIAAVLGLDERTVASHLCRGCQELYDKRAALPCMLEGGSHARVGGAG